MSKITHFITGAIFAVLLLNIGASPAMAQTQTWCHTFNMNLKVGDTGNEVVSLNFALQKEGFNPGEKSPTFDDLTAAAVTGFQQKYASEILTPNGLSYGTGYVGASTRAKLNSLYGCTTNTQPPTSTAPGCLPGYLFSPTTGQSCTATNTSTVSGCTPGALFSSTTGQACVVGTGTVPTVSYVQAKAADLNTIYSGEETLVVGHDFSKNSLVAVVLEDGYNSYTASGKSNADGSRVTFVVPKAPRAGTYGLSVIDLPKNRASNELIVTLIVPSSTVSGCENGALYSSITGAACSTTQSTNSFDLDNNGSINQADAAYLNDVILGERSCPSGKVCDVNSDGKVDVADSVRLINYTKGVSGPAPKWVSPTDSTLSLGTTYTFKTESVPGASGYLFGFKQDLDGNGEYDDKKGEMIWENYQNNRTLSPKSSYTIKLDSRFRAIPLQVWVRAMVNGVWTDAQIKTFNVSGSSTGVPSITSTEAKGQGNFEANAGGELIIYGTNLGQIGKGDNSVYIGGMSTVLLSSVGDTHVSVRVPASLTAGTYDLVARTSAGTSNTVRIRVYSQVSATPSLTITSPTAGETWRAGETKTIRWQGGVAGGTAALLLVDSNTNNVARTITLSTPVSNGSYSWTLPTTSPVPAGSYKLQIADNANNTYAYSGSITVEGVATNPLPTITSVSPSGIAVGGSGAVVTITGSGFLPTSIVLVNNVWHQAVYVSPTTIRVVLTSVDIASVGTRGITVFNAPPGGGTSNVKNLSVTAN